MRKLIFTSIFGLFLLVFVPFMFEMNNMAEGVIDEIEKKKPNSNLEKVIKEHKLKKHQIDSLTQETDKHLKEGKLKKYTYPDMSFCGGLVQGFYLDSNLLFIDAIFKGEIGFLNRKIYWNQGEIIKIEYWEHFPDMEKYFDEYPLEEFEFDQEELTFTDTIYKISLGKKVEMLKLFNEEIINQQIDSALLKRLILCGLDMKEDLENDKQIEN